MQLRSWVLLSTLTAALTGCAEPVNDDDAVDDDAAASCDLAALADAVDPARLDDTLAWVEQEGLR